MCLLTVIPSNGITFVQYIIMQYIVQEHEMIEKYSINDLIFSRFIVVINEQNPIVNNGIDSTNGRIPNDPPYHQQYQLEIVYRLIRRKTTIGIKR